MSKKKEFNIDEVIENATKLLAALSTIVKCGEVILENVKAYRDANVVIDATEPQQQIATDETPAIEEKPAEEPAMTMEQVRAILSAKTNADGGKYKADVKALVKKYANGGILKDVKPEDFKDLVAEVEGL